MDDLLSLIAQSNQLKRIPRMGWLLRGIGPADAESVAEHTYGVAIIALLLAESLDQPVDRGRLLSICLLHDLPETVTADLVPAAVRYLTAAAKYSAEEAALSDLLSDVPSAETFGALWRDFSDGTSTEARLARDADKLDMLIQAAAYEQAGWRGLDEFWETISRYAWEFPISGALHQELVARREIHRLGLAEGTQAPGDRR